MSAAQVVVDADFLSAFLKIEQLLLVRDFYKTDHFLIPPAVYREVSQTSLLQRLAGISWIRVEAPEAQHLEDLSRQSGFLDLGAGEKEAIALVRQLPESVLLMNDNRARRQAQLSGIQAVNIPAFLLACKLSGFLSRDRIAEVVRDLQEKDHYGFRADVLALLLD